MPGTFRTLANSPGGGVLGVGGFAASTLLLLTDGSVLCQSERFKEWRRLTPDSRGDYANGTWSDIAPMLNAREFFASTVLRDGRVAVLGGEFRSGILGIPAQPPVDAAEIWDPATNMWTDLPIPDPIRPASDAPGCLLADGRWLLGCAANSNTMIFDPDTMSWFGPFVKNVQPDEETWTLLPDGSVLAVNTFRPRGVERFLPGTNTWVDEGVVTPTDLADEIGHEIGPAVLLPDGRVFCVGGSGHTALYTPSGDASAGTWQAGPDIVGPDAPNPYVALDAPGCLLPNGHVLFVAGHAASDEHDSAGDPTYFEFDGTTITSLGIPFNAPLNYTFRHRLLLLPAGPVLISWAHPDLWLFAPGTLPGAPAWTPIPRSFPEVIEAGASPRAYGTHLSGISQASSYGDDYQAAENYPIARLAQARPTAVTHYANAVNSTSLSVAPDNSISRVTLTVPSVGDGFWELEMIAAGWPSTVGQAGRFHVQVGGQDGWRWCVQCQGLHYIGNGTGPCPAGGIHSESGSSLYVLPGAAAAGADTLFGAQYCNNCKQLFETAASISNHCAAGGAHDPSGSGEYRIAGYTPSHRGQDGWQWCTKCGTLVFRADPPGSCAAGGAHTPVATPSGLPVPVLFRRRSNDQDNWRWCRNCQCLSFAGSPTLGPCAGGGQHDHLGSGDYVLLITDSLIDYGGTLGRQGTNTQPDWHWCQKCQVLVFAGNHIDGQCPGGGTHDLSASADYTVFGNLPARTAGQAAWRYCHRCQALNFIGNGITGPCPGGGEHDVSGGDYVLFGS